MTQIPAIKITIARGDVEEDFLWMNDNAMDDVAESERYSYTHKCSSIKLTYGRCKAKISRLEEMVRNQSASLEEFVELTKLRSSEASRIRRLSTKM